MKKRVNICKIVTISLLGALTIAAFALSGYSFGEASVFNKAITKNESVNWLYNKIPAIIKTIQIFTIAYIFNFVSKTILNKILSRNNKGKTVVKLLNSFIKYFIAVVAILMILGAWGVDTATLLASAGILTLVIGLGAQSLIADIIAGMFIVFEGEFQVGDIVVIDDWRGTVDEIGIRTTKLIDAGGNVKIINNSQISSIINQTKELSLARSSISIEYGESIQKVELVIKDNLQKIKDSIPEIVDGPYYKGVDALSDSSVDLLFVATCKEENIYIVQRALNRELKILFDENEINIPFPQITVNQPVKFDNKTTKNKEKMADAFAADQREKSKDMEDKN